MHQKGTAAARIFAGTLFGLFAMWFTACLLVFCLISPAAPASSVDAVIVLGGSSEERLPVAKRFTDHAPVLAICSSWS